MSESTPLLPSSAPVVGTHYLTTPRFIAYQLVSLVSAIDGLAGTFTLSAMKRTEALAVIHGATLLYNDGFWTGVALTLGGTVSGLICGIVFLIMMLHPSHGETKTTVLIKEGVFIVAVLALLGILIYSTVVLATHSAVLVTPASMSEKKRAELIASIGSLAYRNLPSAIVFVVLGWVMWLFLFFSLLLVSLAARRVLRKGPVLNAHKQLPERIADHILQRFFGISLAQVE